MKKIQALLMMFVMMVPTVSLSNDIYIEQIGSLSDITLTQQGVDNRIGTALNPSFFGGSSNVSTIEQIGSRNSLDLLMNGISHMYKKD